MTDQADPTGGAPGPAAEPVTATLEIRNRRGLHARAAAKFVKTAAEFNAEVEVERLDSRVSGQSIMGLMMLAAAQGTSIFVSATGPDAAAAVAALKDLVDRKFDED
ncbi:HPr family phosphocarrier protein [Indioceanicola profundi]|uniref:HPr family phosphocarrier protein n=1 Tax=Indioceanicola profundi TaxID=2220096 RepID=UPI000E6ADD16|nr:HPr family phosphocarrier protein [Indioceanicola profundi]